MFQKNDIERYFNAEKAESLIFIAVGCLALIVAAWCFFYLRTTFLKGFAIPLTLIALIQIVVGYSVYKRSDDQRIEMVYARDMDLPQIETKEIPRMEVVMRNFKIYRWVEIFLLISGAIVCFKLHSNPEMQLMAGVGAGTTIQAAIMLFADGFAEHRGKMYLDGLRSLFG